MRVVNWTGITFGELTVQSQIVKEDEAGRRESWVTAKCECGKTVHTKLCNLRTGHTKSCGCENLKRTKVPVGAIMGRLTVLSQEMRHNGKQNVNYSEVKCSCGSPVKWVQTRALKAKSRPTRSCGCLQREIAGATMSNTMSSHGLSKHPSYSVWKNMNRRCHNETCPEYKNYGGRGVKVCDRWRTSTQGAFMNFYHDFGIHHKEGSQIDRKDNNKGYSPENCRWVTQRQNAWNTQRSKWWVINGVKYESLRDASEKLGIGSTTVKHWCNGFFNTETGKHYPPKPNCHSEPKYVS